MGGRHQGERPRAQLAVPVSRQKVAHRAVERRCAALDERHHREPGDRLRHRGRIPQLTAVRRGPGPAPGAVPATVERSVRAAGTDQAAPERTCWSRPAAIGPARTLVPAHPERTCPPRPEPASTHPGRRRPYGRRRAPWAAGTRPPPYRCRAARRAVSWRAAWRTGPEPGVREVNGLGIAVSGLRSAQAGPHFFDRARWLCRIPSQTQGIARIGWERSSPRGRRWSRPATRPAVPMTGTRTVVPAPQYFSAPAWIASRMRWYVPHRQTLRISSRSASLISLPSSRAWRTLATAVMICPGWQ